jgi:hypothetical protein
MRVDERGLGTGALVGIVVGVIVAVVVPVTIVAVLVGGGGAAGGIPVYSGASLLKSNPNISGGGTTDYYDLGTTDCGTVYNWYKSQMAAAGWSVSEYYPYEAGVGGDLVCTKGNDQAEILVVEGNTASQICGQQGFSASKILVIGYVPGVATEAPTETSPVPC